MKFRIMFTLLLGIFLISSVSAVATNVTIFNDTFEGDLTNWTTDWDLITDQFVSTTTSVQGSNEDNDLISADQDMSSASVFIVSFSYRIDDIDANDNIELYYFDGTSYDLIDEI
tara:strand:- start:152 stop:493 length:342 start_codon:yes stop_codon:yes gene_type:complete